MKKLLKLQIVSILFCLISGTLLHFLYEFSNNNEIIATFSSVNESTWEHLKLVFFPMVIFAIIEYFIVGKNIDNYIFAKTCATIFAMFYVTTMFYTYSGIIGDNFLPIDIIIFVLAIVVSEYIAYIIMYDKFNENKDSTKIEVNKPKRKNTVSIIAILVIAASFVICTFNPPKIKYFCDPVTGEYGIYYKN